MFVIQGSIKNAFIQFLNIMVDKYTYQLLDTDKFYIIHDNILAASHYYDNPHHDHSLNDIFSHVNT